MWSISTSGSAWARVWWCCAEAETGLKEARHQQNLEKNLAMIRLIGLTILAFVLGTLAIYAVTLFGTLLYWELTGVHDRDGGGAMGLAFVIAPVVGVMGGVVSAAVVATRLLRKQPDAQANSENGNTKSRNTKSRNTRLAIWVIPAGLLVYAIARFILWIVIGNPYGSFFEVLIISWTPTLLGVAAAGQVFWLINRQPTAQTSSTNSNLES
jgi:hypothetical protein